MNAKVQEFIRERQNEYNEKKQWEYEQQKIKFLIDIDMVDKVYSPKGVYTEEYNKMEYDEKGNCLYYKEVPMNISDEDFEALKKCLKETEEVVENTSNAEHSAIATMLMVLAWILYIGGFIAGFVLGTDRWGELSPMVLAWWAMFFAAGTLYAGFAKVINLLCDIKSNTSK